MARKFPQTERNGILRAPALADMLNRIDKIHAAGKEISRDHRRFWRAVDIAIELAQLTESHADSPETRAEIYRLVNGFNWHFSLTKRWRLEIALDGKEIVTYAHSSSSEFGLFGRAQDELSQLVADNQLWRLRRCACGKYFLLARRGGKHCSEACRRNAFQPTPEAAIKRREYMRTYYENYLKGGKAVVGKHRSPAKPILISSKRKKLLHNE